VERGIQARVDGYFSFALFGFVVVVPAKPLPTAVSLIASPFEPASASIDRPAPLSFTLTVAGDVFGAAEPDPTSLPPERAVTVQRLAPRPPTAHFTANPPPLSERVEDAVSVVAGPGSGREPSQIGDEYASTALPRSSWRP
jgi:hypothetical protein